MGTHIMHMDTISHFYLPHSTENVHTLRVYMAGIVAVLTVLIPQTIIYVHACREVWW